MFPGVTSFHSIFGHCISVTQQDESVQDVSFLNNIHFNLWQVFTADFVFVLYCAACLSHNAFPIEVIQTVASR